jgi:hypothetical protein
VAEFTHAFYKIALFLLNKYYQQHKDPSASYFIFNYLLITWYFIVQIGLFERKLKLKH